MHAHQYFNGNECLFVHTAYGKYTHIHTYTNSYKIRLRGIVLRNTDTFLIFVTGEKEVYSNILHVHNHQVNPTEKLQFSWIKKKKKTKKRKIKTKIKFSKIYTTDWSWLNNLFSILWIQLIMLESLITWDFPPFCICVCVCVCIICIFGQWFILKEEKFLKKDNKKWTTYKLDAILYSQWH